MEKWKPFSILGFVLTSLLPIQFIPITAAISMSHVSFHRPSCRKCCLHMFNPASGAATQRQIRGHLLMFTEAN